LYDASNVGLFLVQLGKKQTCPPGWPAAHKHVLGFGGKDRNPSLSAIYGMSLDCIIHPVRLCTFYGDIARSLESGGID